MKRSLLYLALVLVAAGCAAGDSVSGPSTGTPVVIMPAGAIQNVIGTIEFEDGTTWLRLESGRLRLAGAPVASLSNLIGAEVEVTGTYDGADAFLVNQFAVRMVDGQPAADGILEQADDAYGLRLADGTLRMLIDPPAALTAHVGERVWVSGPDDQPPLAFGVI